MNFLLVLEQDFNSHQRRKSIEQRHPTFIQRQRHSLISSSKNILFYSNLFVNLTNDHFGGSLGTPGTNYGSGSAGTGQDGTQMHGSSGTLVHTQTIQALTLYFQNVEKLYKLIALKVLSLLENNEIIATRSNVYDDDVNEVYDDAANASNEHPTVCTAVENLVDSLLHVEKGCNLRIKNILKFKNENLMKNNDSIRTMIHTATLDDTSLDDLTHTPTLDDSIPTPTLDDLIYTALDGGNTSANRVDRNSLFLKLVSIHDEQYNVNLILLINQSKSIPIINHLDHLEQIHVDFFPIYQNQLNILKNAINHYFTIFLYSKALPSTLSFPPQSILLHGRNGLGKKSTVIALAKELRIPLFYFHIGQEFAHKYTHQSLGKDPSATSPLSKLIQESLLTSYTCILLLDGLELLSKSSSWTDYDDSFAIYLHNKLSILRNSLVFITATCTDDTHLDKLFKPLANNYTSSSQKPIFDSLLYFDSPSIQQRTDFVNHILKKESSFDVSQIARSSNGLSLKQIASILDITALESDDRISQIQSLCEKAKSTLSHHGEFVPEVPRACWSEIYGYQSLKDQLERLVLWPIEKPQVYARLGVTPPSGILLYGPIGCGKTSLVHGIASRSFANFISVKITQIFGKYVGESEQAIRSLFETARASAPCILFLDSLQVIGTKREWSEGDGTSGVQERILSTLLNEMDGIVGLDGVLVIACSTNLESLDDALTRPGRFDSLVYVPAPSLTDRIEILTGIRSSSALQIDSKDIERLMMICEGWSGADIEGLVRDAGYLSLKEDRNVVTGYDLEVTLEMKGIRIQRTD